jgi:serine phosphatase RsbU (regulator of sigma subunit)
LIEQRNNTMTESLLYAKHLQDAILPLSSDLEKNFSDKFFVFYKPSQIVSGDFYWCSFQPNKIILVVADCTGHGVPGAFMSMIAYALLNEIVNERGITDTVAIAEQLNEKIIYSLNQFEGSQKYDGMDVSIVSIDHHNQEIRFTGAHHNMYINDGNLQKIKGDTYSIGGAHHLNSKTFTSKKITYEKGWLLYFLTDGYSDQSGGEENKRFTSKQFENLLISFRHKPMNVQKEILEQTFENWKRNNKQRDDVLVVGIQC